MMVQAIEKAFGLNEKVMTLMEKFATNQVKKEVRKAAPQFAVLVFPPPLPSYGNLSSFEEK